MLLSILHPSCSSHPLYGFRQLISWGGGVIRSWSMLMFTISFLMIRWVPAHIGATDRVKNIIHSFYFLLICNRIILGHFTQNLKVNCWHTCNYTFRHGDNAHKITTITKHSHSHDSHKNVHFRCICKVHRDCSWDERTFGQYGFS